MTVDSTSNLLGTLVSRGYVLDILPYTIDELIEFIDYKYPDMSEKDKTLVVDLANNMGDIIKLAKEDLKQLNTVVDTLCNGVVNGKVKDKIELTTAGGSAKAEIIEVKKLWNLKNH